MFNAISQNSFVILLNPPCFIVFLMGVFDGESLQMYKIGAYYILFRTLNAGQAGSEVDSL